MRNCSVNQRSHSKLQSAKGWWTAGVAAGTLAIMLAWAANTQLPAYAAEAPVGLSTAGTYSVLGGQAVTNTGPTTLGGDLGVSPGAAITGFPPGLVGGATHSGDAAAAQAQSDLTVAYDDAAGRAPTATVAGDLVGQTLLPGVYKSSGPLAVSGALTLNGQGNPNSVFIFQVASALTTASASSIVLTNSAQACNVYWQIGSSATLGTASVFRGTILALTSISVTTGTTVEGRALARNGQVSLDTNVFTMPGCDTSVPSPTPVPSTSAAPAPTTPGSTSPGAGAGAGGGTGTTSGSGAGMGTTSGTGTGVGGAGAAGGTNQGLNIDTAAGAEQDAPAQTIGVTVLVAVLVGAGLVVAARTIRTRRQSS